VIGSVSVRSNSLEPITIDVEAGRVSERRNTPASPAMADYVCG
jgi:hypothetical protein